MKRIRERSDCLRNGSEESDEEVAGGGGIMRLCGGMRWGQGPAGLGPARMAPESAIGEARSTRGSGSKRKRKTSEGIRTTRDVGGRQEGTAWKRWRRLTASRGGWWAAGGLKQTRDCVDPSGLMK